MKKAVSYEAAFFCVSILCASLSDTWLKSRNARSTDYLRVVPIVRGYTIFSDRKIDIKCYSLFGREGKIAFFFLQ